MLKPSIIGFLCNWCGYAAADMAGISRIDYPPNVHIIRVMCTGRIEPYFILRALEEADGVLIGGCHPGTCHYKTGNLHAEERVMMLKEILNLLGVKPKRLRIEWFSASEGIKLARVIREFVTELSEMGPNPLKSKLKKGPSETKLILELMKETDVLYCQECGKCTSICPIANVNPRYSPRLIVERALMEFEEEIIVSPGIWSCLTCRLCQQRCPSNVRYEEFIKACRRKALEKGMKASCSHWEIFYFLSKFMSNPRLDQNRLNWIPNDVKISKKGDLLLFIGCLPYFDVVFKDVNVRSLDIATSMLRILNKAGIKPALLSNERCCGHDSFLMGDLENFQALAKLNVEAIEEAEVKKVVTTCPECYQTLKVEYAKFFKTNFEVLQSSELIADLMDKGKLKLSPLEEKVTYLDPCRLGRYMGIYEQPRRVIKKIPKIELVEVRRSRENALCCGVTAWICSKVSRQVQTKLLNEAKEIGAKTLITACPKCQIHLSCTLNEKAMETYRNILRISDLTTFVNNLVK